MPTSAGIIDVQREPRRIASAEVGLFGSAPLGFAAGDTNLYRYVRNNPANTTDPTGRENSGSPLIPSVPTLSLQEQKDHGAKLLAEMKHGLLSIIALEQRARLHKDVVTVGCLEEKRTQAQGLLQEAEKAYGRLKDAVARKDKPGADAEYEKLAVVHQKLLRLREQADLCVGEAAVCPVTVVTPVEPEKPVPPKEQALPPEPPKQSAPAHGAEADDGVFNFGNASVPSSSLPQSIELYNYGDTTTNPLTDAYVPEATDAFAQGPPSSTELSGGFNPTLLGD
jgi:hypothetical protein